MARFISIPETKITAALVYAISNEDGVYTIIFKRFDSVEAALLSSNVMNLNVASDEISVQMSLPNGYRLWEG